MGGLEGARWKWVGRTLWVRCGCGAEKDSRVRACVWEGTTTQKPKTPAGCPQRSVLSGTGDGVRHLHAAGLIFRWMAKGFEPSVVGLAWGTNLGIGFTHPNQSHSFPPSYRNTVGRAGRLLRAPASDVGSVVMADELASHGGGDFLRACPSTTSSSATTTMAGTAPFAHCPSICPPHGRPARSTPSHPCLAAAAGLRDAHLAAYGLRYQVAGGREAERFGRSKLCTHWGQRVKH